MKAGTLIGILAKNPELELGSVNITYGLFGSSEENKKKVMAEFVSTFGTFDKKTYSWSTSVDLEHHSEDGRLSVCLTNYNLCNIVGKRIEKHKKLVPAVPVEMVEVEDEVEFPVTDCQIKAGLVDEDKVIFNKEPEDALA